MTGARYCYPVVQINIWLAKNLTAVTGCGRAEGNQQGAPGWSAIYLLEPQPTAGKQQRRIWQELICCSVLPQPRVTKEYSQVISPSWTHTPSHHITSHHTGDATVNSATFIRTNNTKPQHIPSSSEYRTLEINTRMTELQNQIFPRTPSTPPAESWGVTRTNSSPQQFTYTCCVTNIFSSNRFLLDCALCHSLVDGNVH